MSEIATVFTVGQGSRTLQDVAAALRARNAQYLCDVRSVPISTHAADFCKAEMTVALRNHGIRYAFFGDLLGGRPKDPAVYDENGHVVYERLMQLDGFKLGISRIRNGIVSGHSIALFCSEGKPEQCHRSKAIGRALTEIGIAVTHVDERGVDATQAEVLSRLDSGDPGLFADPISPLARSRKSYR